MSRKGRVAVLAAVLGLIGGIGYLLISLRSEPATTAAQAERETVTRTRVVRPGPLAVRPGENPVGDDPTPRGPAQPDEADTEPDRPVDLARQRLTRIRMKYRWAPAEQVLGRPIDDAERHAVEERFDEIAAEADAAVGAFDSGGRDERSAIDELRRLEHQYKQAAIDALGMSEEQWAELPELPGGRLPPNLR